MSIRLLMKTLKEISKKNHEGQWPTFTAGETDKSIGHPQGTTIVGIEYKDGIAIAADRIATLSDGSVFSRDFIKLEDIQENSVLAFCGTVALAQEILQDFKNLCDRIESEIMRPISLKGQCKLLKSAVRMNFMDSIWARTGWNFGAILGGYDHTHGKAIYSFDAPSLILHQHNFWADGSGLSQAKTFLHHNFQKNMDAANAVALVIGAIHAAGVFETSVSHPDGDPVPTVKLIDKTGIIDIPERELSRHREETRKMEKHFRNNKSKRKKAASERKSG